MAMSAPLQQVNTFWKRQTKSQRITLVVLLTVAAILIPVLINWATTPSYAVAFSGLSETDAGQVVQKLDANKTPYKLRDAGTIMVPTNLVYEVRLQMATAGLPASGTVGFELFSGNTFGMTQFTEQVNYQRALEGELERTIGSLTAVEAVRVHVVTPEKTLLASDQAATTASITLKVRSGLSLTQAQVQSITHLVASAVEGLKPDNVVIVDTNGNMLASGDGSSGIGASLGQSDSQRSAEAAAAAEVQKKATILLDQVLGPNKSVVQASVAMDWTQQDVTLQTFAATPEAIRSSQKSTESYTTTGDTTGGVPGAGSNLPTPVATINAAGGTGNYQKTDETINYEVSQTQTHQIVAPGQVKRVSLSVLVDGVTDTKQLATLKTAVAAAVGIDAARGDILAVDTLKFDRTYVTQQTADLTKSTQTDLYYKIGEGVAAALVLGALLLYVARLFKNLRVSASEAWVPLLVPASQPTLNPALQQAMIGAGTKPTPLLAKVEEEQALPAAATPSPQEEQMQKILTRMADENPASVAEILQLWLNDDEEKHG